mmetsp:Transcript_5354/g.23881  ORF Transcript_5354/g.23881 Transcript_5354/m.23881 type:complete len:252 (-) Transcript_5354:70-825(-)
MSISHSSSSSAAMTSTLAFLSTTSWSPLNTPRKTVPKFPDPSGPGRTLMSFGSTPGVLRSTFGPPRALSSRFSSQYRFASAVMVSMSSSSSSTARSSVRVTFGQSGSPASSSRMDSYHRFSSDCVSPPANDTATRMSHAWIIPLLSALPPSTSSVTIAPLPFSSRGSRTMPIGRSMVTVRRSFSPVAILQFAAVSGASAFLSFGSAVVVLLPPNMPPNIARGVVAMGSRAVVLRARRGTPTTAREAIIDMT